MVRTQIGGAVADAGNPFTPASKRLSADGSISAGAGKASGYSILEADSLDAAADLAKGCPVLAGGASISVYETLEVMSALDAGSAVSPQDPASGRVT